MPKIDLPLKRLLQRRPADWVKYLQPQCQPDWIRPYQSDFVPKKESRLDNVVEVVDPAGTYLINMEPMGYYDVSLPARMLRYRSDIWESTLNEGKGTPHIHQVVIFFFPQDDNKNHHLSDRIGEETSVNFTYQVIRVWEQDRQLIIDQKLLGLYPLLPLMKSQEDEDPERSLQESIKVIREVQDISLQEDLLAVMAILANGKYSAELINSMIRREMIMESAIFQEWSREAREEGMAKGKAEGICKILNRNLGLESLPFQAQGREISSETILDWIFDMILDLRKPEDVRQVIDAAREQFKKVSIS
jgi:predicted transposase YdaD